MTDVSVMAAYPDQRYVLDRKTRRHSARAHVVRPGTRRCGRAHIDVDNPLPAEEIPTERRCQAPACAEHWPALAPTGGDSGG